MIQGAFAFALSFFLLGAAPQQQQQSQPQTTSAAQQQNIPNAPAPSGLSNLRQDVTPGAGAPAVANSPAAPPTAPSAPQSQSQTFQQQPPVQPAKGENGSTFTIQIPVNYIMVPVTVRDKHHNLVAGLTWRQFKIYEDGQRQRIAFFTVDPLPLSVAFVVDQSLPTDIMRKVNQSLTAITGAFGPADTIAVLTYNTSPNLVTTFTGARGPRVLAALQSSKRPGRDMGVPTVDGPFAMGPEINGQMVDPNLETQRGNAGNFLNSPRDVHPLNDAILAAARLLASQPKGRRRIIYVITDGKESGSKATQKEVIKYLLTNEISVYGTIVGDSAMWGVGYLDKLHLPLLPTDNIMPRYAVMTGGSLDSELSENGIQRSFGAIAASIRNQYTLYYYSRKPALSESRVSLDVDVDVPGLDVTAPLYYYPSLASVER